MIIPKLHSKKNQESASRCYSKEVSAFGAQIIMRLHRCFKFNNKAVTLQELVFMVVILIIIGLAAVIRLVDIPGKTKGTQELALINSLKKALIVYEATYEKWYGRNCSNPVGDPNNCESPFKLLENPPSYTSDLLPGPNFTCGVGKWCLQWYSSDRVWFILCPHCNVYYDCGRGCVWWYFTQDAFGNKAGTFSLYSDCSPH